MRHSTLPFSLAKPIDVKNQVSLLFSSASLSNSKPENANFHNIASQLKMTYHDCGEMTETNLYALNHISKCNIAPENLEVSGSKITLYKKHFLQEINAIVCRVKFHSQQWHCGFEHDSSTHAHHAGITIDLTVTASQCRILANGGSMALKDETLEFNKGPKTTIVKQNDFDDKGKELSNKNRNECD